MVLISLRLIKPCLLQFPEKKTTKLKVLVNFKQVFTKKKNLSKLR
jgi:hypothetical protein